MFYPGQTVECVVDGPWQSVFGGPLDPAEAGPQKGGRYVVGAIVDSWFGAFLEFADFGCCYDVAAFRPIVDDGLEALRRLAADPPDLGERENAPARETADV